MQDVTIKAVLNGWTVKVGCQTLVYVDQTRLLKDLGEYMKDPKAKEKAVIETAVNRRLMTERLATLPPAQIAEPLANCEPVRRN